ncbi:glycerophosphodiester phosphodiesterase family protein [Streptomyces calidiresistens]|uniref:Glycerophosphodiester phosphodiesterase n=1 Tax=Streptomyces calidiresistens TaxID=1485586 RepID=A0A7W3T2R3_9ACTN|nr:glycerophosphodiester phosphodiesterase family protein [Streptomyces calidiresistens]MBB0229872.1 glycerophosphodiester phosphodiesterase [Streptomyces calidiresistens]
MPLLTVGHRGLMGVEPENTLRSFRRARAEGVAVIELDLHLSRDGRLVVMHDTTVDRTTDGTGRVADLDLPDLRALDAGAGERIPLFTEVVEEVDLPIQAEIKDPAAAEVLAGIVTERSLHDRVRVISFHDEALRATRALLPDIAIAVVTGRSTPRAAERALAAGADMVSCELPELTAGVVERCREAGVAVIAWTVNTPADLARVVELGLDGVVTDEPAIVTAARDLPPGGIGRPVTTPAAGR